MTSKKILKMNMPEVNLYIVTVGIASIFLLYYNFYIGVLFFIGFLYMVINNWKTTNIRRKEWTNYIQNLSLDIDETTKKAVMNLPIPLCILEFDGSITWYNGKFNTMIGEDDLLGVNIDDLIKNLNLRKVLNENKEMYTDISYKDREYTIVYNVIKNENGKSAKYLMMLYWIDKTDFLQMQKKYNEEKNAIMLIQVDGYDEVLKSADEENRPLLSVAIEKELTALEMNSNGALKRTSKDKFFLIMNKKELKKLETDKFSVLDQIRKIDYGNNLPVTISIGIGIDGDTINENLKLATGALDLALGRGGDQAVIKTKDKFAFYGGKSKAVEKTTKVKSRLIGHALREVILESDHVFIMGHKYPDMDAMGAAVGIYDICKSCNKTANIVLDHSNESIEEFIKRIKRSDYHDGIFVDCDYAIRECMKNTLVVVVDTHRPNFTECPQLLEISDKVVVIDHHRRGVDFINDTVLLFHEIYVSSTCEMVTELVQYIEDDVRINKLTAEGLLAGISLDTKNFAFKTGVRTFEAASYLKKSGADTIEVKKLFNSDIKDFITKAEIIQNAKDDRVFISARSLGNINVHVLMENLGGGGHRDMAGAQLDTSLEKAYEMVKDTIQTYIKEEE